MWSQTGKDHLDADAVKAAILRMPDMMVEADGRIRHREDYDRQALREARRRRARTRTRPTTRRVSYARQIAAIDAVVHGRRKSIDGVELSLEQKWIPLDVISAFMSSKRVSRRGACSQTTPSTRRPTRTLGFAATRGSRSSRKAATGLRVILRGTVTAQPMSRSSCSRARADHPVMKYMNGLGIPKEMQQSISQYNAVFNDWRQRPREAHRRRLYSRKFFDVPGRYSGADLGLKGITDKVKPHPYQNETVRQVMDTGRGIVSLDRSREDLHRHHDREEATRRGRAQRQMFVVPKSVATNWKEIETLMPGSRTSRHRRKSERNGKTVTCLTERDRKLAMLQQNVTTSSAARVPRDPIKPTTQSAGDRASGRRSGRRVELRLQARRGRRPSRPNRRPRRASEVRGREGRARAARQEGQVFWEDLRIDGVIVDEAHSYKNTEAAEVALRPEPEVSRWFGDVEVVAGHALQDRGDPRARGEEGRRACSSSPRAPAKNSRIPTTCSCRSRPRK